MSKITLKPLDDGQKAVEIPVGKTTIGRGPFLGCSDKKVSRNHAVLEVTTKGEVFLTPTHVNPCFYQPTVDSPGTILKKDVPHELQSGDSFSLLPRAYRYQLIIVKGESSQNEDQTDPNKQAGKTNGSVSSELLNDGAATNEELGDTSNTIVPEKSFNKEESPNVEKSSPNNISGSKEESTTFSKKIAEIKDNNAHDLPTKADEAPSEKAASPPNGADQIVPEIDPPPDADPEPKSEADSEEAKDKEPHPKAEEPEENESSDEGYDDAEEKLACSSPNKTVMEESTAPDAEANAKSKAEETEQDETSALSPKQKTPEKEPSPALDPPDIEDSNEPSDEVVPEAKPEQVPPLTIRTGRKKGTASIKKPKKEKQAPKRKSEREEESSPKRKGRKKKMSFDDGHEGTSHTPGRTSSRTNRQTRQGLSLDGQ